MSTDNDIMSHLAVYLLHCLCCHSLSCSKKEDAAIRIILVVEIEMSEERTAWYRLRKMVLQQLGTEPENHRIADNPFCSLIAIIKLPVLLKLYKMIKIRGYKHTITAITREVVIQSLKQCLFRDAKSIDI